MANKKIELIALLEERQERNKRLLMINTWNSLYPWQREFVASTKDHTSCCLMCANRIGKTYTGILIDSFHLTGEYPDDWNGHRFESPPLIWLLGVTGEKTRDLLQTPLFGRIEGKEFCGGLISSDKIINYRSMTGTSGAMREVRIKHKLGISTVQFWSYSQGQGVLMGDSLDWYHIDEEPKDQTIYPQVLTRTATGDQGRGGRGILTFTPENGRTETVIGFMDSDIPSQFFMNKGWNDAPHLTEETKTALLAKFPAYQRDMRSKGIPLMGTGMIYEHSEDDISCDPFEIPAHWYLINGMDFGWDHPQAHIQLAWDMGADAFYVVHAFKKSKIQPFEAWHVVKGWSEDVPTAWPHDGLQTEKGSAKQQKDYYEEAGFEMCDEHATWEEGGNGVEAGLMELNNLMKTGRFKVFSHLKDVFEEVRQYHRVSKPNGKSEIVKVKEDLLDACFIGETEVITRNGLERIDSLVGTNGEVLSIDGEWKEYNHCRLTKKQTEVITITFSDGHEVTCTPDHRFLTCNGWKEAIHLHDESIIMAGDKCLIQSCLTEGNTQGLVITIGQGISYIEQYGNTTTDQLKRACKFITSTLTRSIITLKTLSALRQKITARYITKTASRLISLAGNAAINLKASCRSLSFAAISVNQNTAEKAELMTCKETAKDAQPSSSSINIQRSSIAEKVASERTGQAHQKASNTLKISRIRSAKESDVYCMEVNDTNAFALANGVIAHNCRYAYMMRRHAIQKNDIGRNYYEEDDYRGDDTNAMGY